MIRRLKEENIELLEAEAAEQCKSCLHTLMRKAVRDMNDTDEDGIKIVLTVSGFWEKPTVFTMETTGKCETKLVHTDETVAFKLNTGPKQLTPPGTEEA